MLEKMWVISPPFQNKSFYISSVTIAELGLTSWHRKKLKLSANVTFNLVCRQYLILKSISQTQHYTLTQVGTH